VGEGGVAKLTPIPSLSTSCVVDDVPLVKSGSRPPIPGDGLSKPTGTHRVLVRISTPGRPEFYGRLKSNDRTLSQLDGLLIYLEFADSDESCLVQR
jgi:hypothetical protein